MAEILNIGKKISRIRELRGMKQETLAAELGISQQAISKLEQCENVEDGILEKVAGILGVPVEAIKKYSDEQVIYNIQNNYEGSNNHGNQGPFSNYGSISFNPIDKIVELYERLLNSEKQKNNSNNV